METICTAETSVLTRATRRHIKGDRLLDTVVNNIKSHHLGTGIKTSLSRLSSCDKEIINIGWFLVTNILPYIVPQFVLSLLVIPYKRSFACGSHKNKPIFCNYLINNCNNAWSLD
jgi:hypothetical protein